jgi:hypothetical protein
MQIKYMVIDLHGNSMKASDSMNPLIYVCICLVI